ncbi:MAG TPA: hypothetical protein VE359_13930 [Vicinamibacteria bacterium]|nr:hypothetical protein [Vicinamibacteria bacterium]
MSDVTAHSIFGNTERVFVYDKAARGEPHRFVVRPAVVVVDGNQIRFRNFTDHEVTVDASFLQTRSVRLARRGAAGDRQTVPLGPGIEPRYYDYGVTVDVDGKQVNADGESRPGAIIDR